MYKLNYARGLHILLLMILSYHTIAAQIDDIGTYKFGGKYYNYPYLKVTPPALTPSPDGYEPFHLEHYGRHGSRWHIGYKFYEQSYEILKKAHHDKQLTIIGEQVYQTIKKIKETAQIGKSGELTEKGALQHQVIATRMVDNFPQLFVPEANLVARSTIIIRAILSMHNSLNAIRAKCPLLNMSSDASSADMWYLYSIDDIAQKIKQKADTTILKQFKLNHRNNRYYLRKLIKDINYANDSIGDKLFIPLFNALINCQSHFDQPWLVDSIFTATECREFWLQGNAGWFIHGGNSKLTENRMPFSQANLLMNIITSTDSALVSHTPSINLRYGHDSVLLPLIVLMEVDDFGVELNNLEEIADKGWNDYCLIPMAANLQMIFYRIPGNINKNDILVKVLLNEKEVKLPIGNVSGPYYNWKLLREYYLQKIASYTTTPQ